MGVFVVLTQTQIHTHTVVYIKKWLVVSPPLGWRTQRRNNTERRLLGQRLMRLATQSTVTKHMCRCNMRRSSNRGFFPPSLFPLSPPIKSCYLLQKKQ